MRTKTAKRILSETPQEVKNRAEKWAEELLEQEVKNQNYEK